MAPKSVILIGLPAPKPEDEIPPGLDREKLVNDINSIQADLDAGGYDALSLLVGPDDAVAEFTERLKEKKWDFVCIGAGIRLSPKQFLLFEQLINVAHEHAPQAKLCFNTSPSSSLEAVKRWDV